MRKVVVSEFVTLDGVFEDPAWTLQFQSEEQNAFKFAELKAAGALLLGPQRSSGSPEPRCPAPSPTPGTRRTGRPISRSASRTRRTGRPPARVQWFSP